MFPNSREIWVCVSVEQHIFSLFVISNNTLLIHERASIGENRVCEEILVIRYRYSVSMNYSVGVTFTTYNPASY